MDKVQIIKDYPPNYKTISDNFDLKGQKPIFAYDGKIYNPHGDEIDADIILHEKVHIEQQKKFANSDLWWSKYIFERDFRLDQELDAYGQQYAFIKKHLPNRISRLALADFGDILSSPMYDVNISKSQAEAMIKRKSKEVVV